jgi:hypothetical protein
MPAEYRILFRSLSSRLFRCMFEFLTIDSSVPVEPVCFYGLLSDGNEQ